MADQSETFTLDELHTIRVPDGRCPHCGRPAEANEKATFEGLRADLAEARTGRDAAQKEADNLRDSNDRYDAEVVRLKQKLEEAG